MTLDDCRRFYAEEIPFAANVSSPAPVEAFARLPPLWFDRLREGGRLLLPYGFHGCELGEENGSADCTRAGLLSAKAITLVAKYSATSVRDPQLEPLLGRALGM